MIVDSFSPAGLPFSIQTEQPLSHAMCGWLTRGQVVLLILSPTGYVMLLSLVLLGLLLLGKQTQKMKKRGREEKWESTSPRLPVAHAQLIASGTWSAVLAHSWVYSC